MKTAIVENGIVTNIIVANRDYGKGIYVGDLPLIIGDEFDGIDFWRDGKRVTLQQPDGGLEEIIDILTGEGEGE